MSDYVIYDTETKKLNTHVKGGWDNVYDMEMSSAVTYDSKTNLYQFWTDRNNLCEFLNKKVVIGFNSIWFDSKLLLGNDRIIELNGVTKNDKYWWYNADLYVEVWRNIFGMSKTNYPDILKKIKETRIPTGVFNLDGISRATLNISKSGKGEHAPMLFQQGKFAELFEYNLQDVRVTKELFLFIKQYRYVVNGNYDIIRFT